MCYTQWLWRTVKTEQMTVGALNAAFGADTSVLSLLNVELLQKLRIGYIMAAFAWYCPSHLHRPLYPALAPLGVKLTYE